MKKLAIILSVIACLSACSDGPSKDGENQVTQPVQNSGPETEANRAIEAGKDSAHTDNASDTLHPDAPKK